MKIVGWGNCVAYNSKSLDENYVVIAVKTNRTHDSNAHLESIAQTLASIIFENPAHEATIHYSSEGSKGQSLAKEIFISPDVLLRHKYGALKIQPNGEIHTVYVHVPSDRPELVELVRKLQKEGLHVST